MGSTQYDDQKQQKYSNKLLLTIPELMDYTGFGEKTIRRIINSPTSNFTIRNGVKLYVHRELFEEYIKKCAKFQLTL